MRLALLTAVLGAALLTLVNVQRDEQPPAPKALAELTEGLSWEALKLEWPKSMSAESVVAVINDVSLYYANVSGLSRAASWRPRDALREAITLELTRQRALVTFGDAQLKALAPSAGDREWAQRTSHALNELLGAQLLSSALPAPQLTQAQGQPKGALRVREVSILSLARVRGGPAEAHLLAHQLTALREALTQAQLSFEEATRRHSPLGAPLRGLHKVSLSQNEEHSLPLEVRELAFSLPLGQVSEPLVLDHAALLLKPSAELTQTQDPSYQARKAEGEALRAALHEARKRLAREALEGAHIQVPTSAFTHPLSSSTPLLPITLPSPHPQG